MKTISECIREYGFTSNFAAGSRVKEHTHKYLELARKSYKMQTKRQHRAFCTQLQRVIMMFIQCH